MCVPYYCTVKYKQMSVGKGLWHVGSAEQIMDVLGITFVWYLMVCRSVEIYGGTGGDIWIMSWLFVELSPVGCHFQWFLWLWYG